MADSDDTLAPTIFVLFGATGDLAKRMVLPAFWMLAQRGMLPADWRLVGNGRGDVAHEDFRAHVHDVLTADGSTLADDEWEAFAARLLFAGGGFGTDDPGSLLDVLSHVRTEMGGDPQHVHYFAVPPVAFPELTKALGEHDLAAGSRVVYEKPYGTSPESFRELDEVVHSVLEEDQVFRIDHFLGKEATQDLHVLRFTNELFACTWNREHVEQVQIDVPETLDIDDRAVFYDATGATLDMLVTHLFQVAAEVAMEPPASMRAADLQDARESVITAFRPLTKDDVVLGQYEGYLDVEGVAAGSTTDTFVAARLWVDTDRWHGVPFLLRTGKRLAVGEQLVTLVLRTPEGPLTHVPPQGGALTFSMSGDGRFSVALVAKRPGEGLELSTGTARLSLDDVAGAAALSPYASLIHDVLVGDRSLFTSTAGLAHAWTAVEPLLSDRPAVQPYAQGSMGPAAADELTAPGRWLLDT